MASKNDHEFKMANLTRQMRYNQSDLQSFISDLDSWESDIKKKEENLLSGKAVADDSLPPVRNTIHKKKLKKKKKEKTTGPEDKKQKIPGSDFRAWDKFDVDAALEDIDKEVKRDTSSSEYETDEEWEMERKKHLAGIEKDKGNKFFKAGDYDKAVEAYSRGIEFDSTNAVLHANRAMALLKQQKYAAAELDCTSSLSLDPLYVKAYLRRATARANLNKHKEAVEDYNRVLDFEPTNKMAQTELERLQKEKDRDEKVKVQSTLIEGEKGVVKAIYKSPDERSKVPLKRIKIEEIGIETVKRVQQPLSKQSEITKKITERESKNFDTLVASSHTPKSSESAKQEALTTSLSTTTPLNEGKASKTSHKINELSTTTPSNSNAKCFSEKPESRVNLNDDNKKNAKVNGEHRVVENSVDSATSSKSSSSNQQADKQQAIPSIPHSSFQFQTDFKVLKNKPQDFFKYFTAIRPSQYPGLFGQCLDADILKTIISCLLQYGRVGSGVNVYDVLLGLTNVKRFSMTAMFLSHKEKQGARELMEHITASSLCSAEELSSLKKKYDL